MNVLRAFWLLFLDIRELGAVRVVRHLRETRVMRMRTRGRRARLDWEDDL